MGDNLDTLERLIAKLHAGDHEGALNELHEDLVVDEPTGLPQSGQWRGKDASSSIRKLVASLWDWDMGPMRRWESGDVVFAHRVITWTSKATGKAVTSPQIEMFEFNDGKIARVSVYIQDAAGVAGTLVK